LAPYSLLTFTYSQHNTRTYKAVSNTTNLLEALLLQVIETLLDNRVDSFESMRILPIRALSQPFHNVKALRSVEGNWVAVKEIGDNGVIAIGSELVCHQLAVLPDTDYIWEVEDGGILVDSLASGLGDVCVDVTDFDGFASWLSTLEMN
jgi:hypothetical protein